MNPKFKRGDDTGILVSLLAEGRQEVSYDDMSKALGRDVRTYCRCNMSSALRIVERENKIHYRNVRGIGYVRETHGEAVSTVQSTHISRVRSTARRGHKKLSHTDFDSLPAEKKKEYVVTGSMLSCVELFAKKKTHKELTNNVKDEEVTTGVVAIGRTLQLFSKNGD